jgi:hypothetical protein
MTEVAGILAFMVSQKGCKHHVMITKISFPLFNKNITQWSDRGAGPIAASLPYLLFNGMSTDLYTCMLPLETGN